MNKYEEELYSILYNEISVYVGKRLTDEIRAEISKKLNIAMSNFFKDLSSRGVNIAEINVNGAFDKMSTTLDGLYDTEESNKIDDKDRLSQDEFKKTISSFFNN